MKQNYIEIEKTLDYHNFSYAQNCKIHNQRLLARDEQSWKEKTLGYQNSTFIAYKLQNT